MTTKDEPGSGVPYLTHDLPGIGGVIKQRDEDFVVEELPLYEPSGEGTHAYITIEKRGLTTPAAVSILASALGRPPRDIGYAGLKDAHGVTRQTFSIEHVEPARIQALGLTRFRILSVTRHTNKLKLGHLAGNRFVIQIRGVRPRSLETARAIVDVLATRGVPNYFGPQRFGARGDNAAIGRAVLRDDYDEALALMLGRPQEADTRDMLRGREFYDAGDLEAAAKAWARASPGHARVCRALLKARGHAARAWHAVDHSMRKFYISAVQSELFNQVLSRRLDGVDRVITGDVAWKHDNGACFVVEDAAVEQPRCDAFQISPSGPLFGLKMKEPGGEPARIEQEVLDASGPGQGADPRQGWQASRRYPPSTSRSARGTDDRGGRGTATAHCFVSDFIFPPAHTPPTSRARCANPAS